MKRFGFFFGGLVVALFLAGLVSPVASGAPDGLEHVLQRGCSFDDEGEIISGTCPAEAEQEHTLADGLFADYGVQGVENEALGTAVSGVVGVLMTLLVGGGLFWLLRRRSPTPAVGPNGATAGSDAEG